MKNSGKFPLFYGWQDAYATFTYSIREKDMIIEYIKNQKEHHKKESFFDEYKRLLIENARLTGRAGNCIWWKIFIVNYSTLSGLFWPSIHYPPVKPGAIIV